MADLKITYQGSDIVELSDSATKTLKTGGTYCEDDIEVAYVKPSGGGGLTLLASGKYTTTEIIMPLLIPIPTITGTPMRIVVNVPQDRWLPNTNQSVLWEQYKENEFSYTPSAWTGWIGSSYAVSDSLDMSAYTATVSIDNSNLRVLRTNSLRPIQPNTYDWYIWGVEE